MLLKIDQEFKNLIPPLTHEERELLEKNIIKEGCRDPLVAWNGFLLDGHNRYNICNANSIEYNVVEVELKDRNEAINWIIDNQLGKRNVSEIIKGFLSGKRLQNEKQRGFKGNQYTSKNNGERQSDVQQNITQSKLTAVKIAEQLKVSPRTIERNEVFAESMEKIAESSGKTAMDILTNTKITQEDAKKIATLEPNVQKEIVNNVTSGKSKSFKEALKPIIKKQETKAQLKPKPETEIEQSRLIMLQEVVCPINISPCPKTHIGCDHWYGDGCNHEFDTMCPTGSCGIISAKKPNAICPYCHHNLIIDFDKEEIIYDKNNTKTK